jgi:hypothetical protein
MEQSRLISNFGLASYLAELQMGAIMAKEALSCLKIYL